VVALKTPCAFVHDRELSRGGEAHRTVPESDVRVRGSYIPLVGSDISLLTTKVDPRLPSLGLPVALTAHLRSI
jgi:hypothetical protein